MQVAQQYSSASASKNGIIPEVAICNAPASTPRDQRALLSQLQHFLIHTGSVGRSTPGQTRDSRHLQTPANLAEARNTSSASLASLSTAPSSLASTCTSPTALSGMSTPSSTYDGPAAIDLNTLHEVLATMTQAPLHAASMSACDPPSLPPMQPITPLVDDKIWGLSQEAGQTLLSDEPLSMEESPLATASISGRSSERLAPGFPFQMPAARLDRSVSMTCRRVATNESGSDVPSPSAISSSSGSTTPMGLDDNTLRRPRSRSLPALPVHSQCPLVAPDSSLHNALKARSVYINKKAQKLLGSLTDIIDSERAYVENLAILKEVYFDVLDTTIAASDDAKQVIRRNLDALLFFHRKLAISLGAVDGAGQWRQQPALQKLLAMTASISNVFAASAPGLSIYEDFCARHSDAMAVLRQCQEDKQAWELYTTLCASRMTSYHKSLSSDRKESNGPALHLYDYAIKPVQRICQYPMLFESLSRVVSEKVPDEREAALAVKAALRSISKSAAGVDRARQKMLNERRTNLVASRIELPHATQPAFLSILGQVHLVGAMYFTDPNPVDQIMRVKYYGCFLYATHLVLVKVRRPDGYEPRHWWPLRIFEVEALAEDEGTLPHSIRLTYGRYQFELAAVSKQERDLWYDRLSDTTDLRRQYWRKNMLQASSVALNEDVVVSSIPVDVTAENYFAPASEIPSISNTPRTTRAKMTQRASNLMGRSVTTSRAAVDLRMADIFSDECLMARANSDLSSLPRNLRSKSTDARFSPAPSNSVSRRGTLRDAARRKSAIFETARSVTFHRRRSSVDAISHTKEEGELLDDALASAPNSPTLGNADLPTCPAGLPATIGYAEAAAKRGWRASLRHRRLSFVAGRPSPSDTPINDGTDADVMRNGSSSSSGSSQGLMVQTPSPGSSAPPSPLITPSDSNLPWAANNSMRDILFSLKRKGSSVSLRKRSPSLGSPEQDALAASATEFLYGGTEGAKPVRPSLVSWVGTKSKRTSSNSTHTNASRRTNSASSLINMFSPSLAMTSASPLLPAPEPPRPAEPAKESVMPNLTRTESSTSGETLNRARSKLTRQRSLNMFKTLTRMTTMTNVHD